MKRIIILLLTGLLVVSCAAVKVKNSPSGNMASPGVAKYIPATFSELFDASAPSVVVITSYEVKTEKKVELGNGSGFIIDPSGYIVTNFHVIEGADSIGVNLKDGDQEYEAIIVGRDPNTDITVLKIEGEDFPALEFGDSSAVKVGDWVIAIGAPFDYQYTLTQGVVSAKRRYMGIGLNDMVQTSASINPGNSGGPLIAMNGKVIGINTLSMSMFDVKGISFAVSADVAKEITSMLIKHGKVLRGFVGARIEDRESGVTIVEIIKGYPAEAAGLKIGDIIVSVNGKETEDTQNTYKLIANLLPGKSSELAIERGGEKQTILITPVKRLDSTDVERKIPEPNKKFDSDNDLAVTTYNECLFLELGRIRNLPKEEYFQTLDGQKIPMDQLAGLPPGFQHYDSQIITAESSISPTAKNKRKYLSRVWWLVPTTCRKKMTGDQYPDRYGDIWEVYRPNGEFLGFGRYDQLVGFYVVFISPHAKKMPIEAI